MQCHGKVNKAPSANCMLGNRQTNPYFLRSIYIEHRVGCYSKRVHALKCVLLQYMADGIN